MSGYNLRLKFGIPRRIIRKSLSLLLIGISVSELASEPLTITSYYPAASGINTNLMTRSDVSLAVNGGKVVIGQLASSYTGNAKLYVNGMLETSSSIILGNDTSACTSINQGSLKYAFNTLMVCEFRTNQGIWNMVGGTNPSWSVPYNNLPSSSLPITRFNTNSMASEEVTLTIHSTSSSGPGGCFTLNVTVDGVNVANPVACNNGSQVTATFNVPPQLSYTLSTGGGVGEILYLSECR